MSIRGDGTWQERCDQLTDRGDVTSCISGEMGPVVCDAKMGPVVCEERWIQLCQKKWDQLCEMRYGTSCVSGEKESIVYQSIRTRTIGTSCLSRRSKEPICESM